VVRVEPDADGLAASDTLVSAPWTRSAKWMLSGIGREQDRPCARVWKLAGEHTGAHQADAGRPLIIDVDTTPDAKSAGQEMVMVLRTDHSEVLSVVAFSMRRRSW
jgi:hypothetical protein